MSTPIDASQPDVYWESSPESPYPLTHTTPPEPPLPARRRNRNQEETTKPSSSTHMPTASPFEGTQPSPYEPPLPPRRQKNLDVTTVNLPATDPFASPVLDLSQLPPVDDSGLPGGHTGSYEAPELPPRRVRHTESFYANLEASNPPQLHDYAELHDETKRKGELPGTTVFHRQFRRFDAWFCKRFPRMQQHRRALYVLSALFLFSLLLIILFAALGLFEGGAGGDKDFGLPGLSISGRGDGTFYDPGVGIGSCGWQNTGLDTVVALNAPQYGVYPNPADSPVCGKCLKITGPKGTVKVKIVDKCPICRMGDVDMAPAAFDQIADERDGRVKVTWTGC